VIRAADLPPDFYPYTLYQLVKAWIIRKGSDTKSAPQIMQKSCLPIAQIPAILCKDGWAA
jgi:hypothetical protein